MEVFLNQDQFSFDQEPVINNDGFTFTQPETFTYDGPGLDTRAQKYNFAIDIDVEEAKAALASGDENRLRELSQAISKSRTEAARVKLLELGQQPPLEPTVTTPSAFENEFGAKVSTTLAGFLDPGELAKNPEALDMILSQSTEGFSRKEILSSVYQKWLPKIKDATIASSWGNLISTDVAELFVPGLNMYQWNRVADQHAEGGILTSGNIEELISSVLRLPDEQAKVKLDEIMTDLFSRNAYLAAQFLDAMDNYSTSDAYWDNFFDVLNIPITGAYKKVFTKASKFIRPETVKMSGVVEATGDLESAARLKVTERLQTLMKTTGTDPKSIERVLENIPSISNPSSIIQPTANFSSRQADRLVKELETTTDKLLSSVSDVLNVKRFDEGTQALKVAYQEAETAIRQRLGHVSGAIMDVRTINADSNLANVAGVEARLGRIAVQEPPVKEGYVRFYHGALEDRPPSAGGDRWVTPYKQYARDFRSGDTPKTVWYIDLKKGSKEELAARQWTEADEAAGINNVGQYLSGFQIPESMSKNFRRLDSDKPQIKIDLTPQEISAVSRTEGRDAITLKAANQNDRKKRQVTISGQPYTVSEKVLAEAANSPRLIPVEISIGKLDAGFFETQEQALKHADEYYGLPKGTYNIVEEAPSRFYISVVKNIDETTPSVRKALIEDLRGKEPNSWTETFLRKIGSAETLMSRSMSANRKVAAHGISKLLDEMARHLDEKLVKPLSKQDTAQFKAFLTRQRDFESAKGDVLGKFSKNQMEFETEWRQMFGTIPNENITTAYWNYVAISDFDYALRNLSVFSKMSQEGWGLVGLSTRLFKMKKPLIEGKIVDEIPEHKGFFARAIKWDPDGNHAPVRRKDIAQLKAEGYKIVKLHSEGARKMSSVKELNVGQDVKYILAKDVAEGPLSMDRVAYNAGGHRVHIDDWFVSAEQVRLIGEGKPFEQNVYKGDFNISSHMVQDQAKKMMKTLEEARKLYLAKDMTALGNYIKNNFPSTFTMKQFTELYTKHGLNPNSPFKLRRKDQNLIDSYDLSTQYKNLTKQSDNPHYLDESLEDTSYVGKREPNLPSYTFEGTAHNPMIRVGTSRLLDPLSTLARTTLSNAKGLYLDDMKIRHAQDFMARYGDLVELPNAAEAQYNPIASALSAPFKEGVPDLNRLAAAKAYRESIKNFLQIDDILQTEVKTFREKMLNSTFKRFGMEGAEFVEPYLMHKIKDPVKYLRNAAFHTKIGMFNLPSFSTQLMQFTTMAGIAGPVRASEALAWAQYAAYMRHASPEVRKAIAKKAGEWGGAPSDFEDYYTALRRSGLLTVRGEVAELGDDKAFKVTQSAAGKILDWGRYPFDLGERLSRTMAFQIAFREWRAKEGVTKALTDDDLRQVIGRADLLTGNMTRASLMSWQKGVATLPVQFLNWHIRMTEQMLNSTLTAKEKTRLILTNAILFGAPAGFATAPLTNIIPWKAGFDEFFNAMGVSSADNQITDTVINGIVGTFFEYMVGDRFNPNEKFGPGVKNPLLERLFEDEESFLVTLTGVAGSTIQDMTRVAIPVLAHIGARVGLIDADVSWWDIKEELDRVISGLGSANRALAVLNTGQYLSKNQKFLAEVDNWKAYAMLATGMQPDVITRTAEKQTHLNIIKGFQSVLEPRMLSLHRQMYRHGQEGDLKKMEEVEKQLKAYYIISGMTQDEIGKFEYRAFQNMDKSWVDSVNEKLGKRNEYNLGRIIREENRNNAR